MAQSRGLATGGSQTLLVAPAFLLLLLLQPSSAHWQQERKHHGWPKLTWSRSSRCPPPARRHLPPRHRPPPPAHEASSCETCYTIMATYIGTTGPEPVPPRWRYSKDTCTQMGDQLAGALNAYVEAAADVKEDSSSSSRRSEYGMRSSRCMLKPFTSRGCIAEDEYGFRGAQVCGSFRSAEAADALVATLMDDGWKAAHVLLKHLGRQGTLCQLPGYQFYLTTFVAPDKPWGVLNPEGVCSKFFFSAEVLC